MNDKEPQPKDVEVIKAILKDLNITDYEPRIINHLLDFSYSKITVSAFIAHQKFCQFLLPTVIFFRIRFRNNK